MARDYVLAVETSLFGDASLIREWGRITNQDSEGSISMTTSHVQCKPSRLGSSESGDAAICCEADREGA